MARNFFDLSYLASGSDVQQKGFNTIRESRVMNTLHAYMPVLAGTLPLDLFLPESDLDILCFCPDLQEAEAVWRINFSSHKNFFVKAEAVNNTPSLIGGFESGDFRFELFAQDVPTDQQAAYRHMITEFNILESQGSDFREKILELKRSGLKTEPAFARLLGLSGDPYQALLTYPL